MSIQQQNCSDSHGYTVSLIAIQICLLMNVLFFVYAKLYAVELDSENILTALKTPVGISTCISAIVFILMLTATKAFEFLFFFAFASAGFWGYLAYCDGASLLESTLYWLALALITRRLGVIFAYIMAFVAIVAGVIFNINFVF